MNVILACILLITGLVNTARAAPSGVHRTGFFFVEDDGADDPRTKSTVLCVPRVKTKFRNTLPASLESSQERMTSVVDITKEKGRKRSEKRSQNQYWRYPPI